LAQGLEFIQRTRLTALGQCFFDIFGEPRWITEYLQIRIAVRILVVALVGIFGGIFVYWITENSREAKSHSLISLSELAFSDVSLSHPASHQPGGWEVRGAIKNNSPRTLSGLWLKITVRDCPNDSACVTIGEEIKHIVINCPPSQTHIIDESDLFSNEMLIPEKLEWSYEIVQTDAK